MPYVEGDRSDCQPSTTTIALSLYLRAIELASCWQSDLSPSTQGMIFIIFFFFNFRIHSIPAPSEGSDTLLSMIVYSLRTHLNASEGIWTRDLWHIKRLSLTTMPPCAAIDYSATSWKFLTTAIFTGSASTVDNSLKIMFQNVTFWCCPDYDTCLSTLSIPFLE